MNSISTVSTLFFHDVLYCTSLSRSSHPALTLVSSDVRLLLNQFPVFIISTGYSLPHILLFLTYFIIFNMCLKSQNKGQLVVADQHYAFNCEPNSLFLCSLSSHLSTPASKTRNLWTIALACMKRDSIFKAELLKVSLDTFLSLSKASAGIIHVQEVLDSSLIRDLMLNYLFLWCDTYNVMILLVVLLAIRVAAITIVLENAHSLSVSYVCAWRQQT